VRQLVRQSAQRDGGSLGEGGSFCEGGWAGLEQKGTKITRKERLSQGHAAASGQATRRSIFGSKITVRKELDRMHRMDKMISFSLTAFVLCATFIIVH
jgi:hypothetical protein